MQVSLRARVPSGIQLLALVGFLSLGAAPAAHAQVLITDLPGSDDGGSSGSTAPDDDPPSRRTRERANESTRRSPDPDRGAPAAAPAPEPLGATVAITELRGRGGDRLHAELRDALSARGIDVHDGSPRSVRSAGGARAVITGRIRRRGRRLEARLTVLGVDRERVGRAMARGRNPRELADGLIADLIGALREVPGAVPPPKRIVVDDFTGPGASRVRMGVVRALADVSSIEPVTRDDLEGAAARLNVDTSRASGFVAAAREAEVAARVEGDVERRRGGLQLTIDIRNGADGESLGRFALRGRNPTRLAREAEAQVAAAITPVLADASIPAPLPEPEPEEAPDLQSHYVPLADADAPEDDGPEGFHPALDLGIYLGLFRRSLEYTDDVFGALRAYKLNIGPAIRLKARWYPGAHATSGWISHLGLDVGYERSIAVDSERADGTTFPTTMQAYDIGLRGRLPIGHHEASLGVGYGAHSFELDPAGPAEPGGANLPEIPDVGYRFIRTQAEGRFSVAPEFAMTLRASYQIIFDAGGIGTEGWFPHLDVSGADLEVEFAYVIGHFEIRLSGQYRRYWYSMNPQEDDLDNGVGLIAGGAVDQYLSGALGFAFRM